MSETQDRNELVVWGFTIHEPFSSYDWISFRLHRVPIMPYATTIEHGLIACPCPNAEPIAYDSIFTIKVRGIGLYPERTRKVCMLHSSGSRQGRGKRDTEKFPHGYTCSRDALSMRPARYHCGIYQVSSTTAATWYVHMCNEHNYSVGLDKRRVDAGTQGRHDFVWLRLFWTSRVDAEYGWIGCRFHRIVDS